MKISMDKKTGIISSEYGWQLEFSGRSQLRVKGSSDDVLINIEILGEGMEIVLYNDLELRGISKEKSVQIMNVAESVLKEMGFRIEIN